MEIVERYQILLEKDPRSQVFAPLAEAYRKFGMIEEAFRICVRGVQYNPHFAGGRISLAKVMLERGNPKGALAELEKAIDLSPDNILAHQMMAELQLGLKNAKQALKSYKMVLFLAPTNERAQKAVSKLESLTADEFEDDVFSMKPLTQVDMGDEDIASIQPMAEPQIGSKSVGDLERYLSLADAYIVRNDFDRAMETLREAEHYHAHAPELLKRLKLLSQRTSYNPKEEPAEEPLPNRKSQLINQKIDLLTDILHKFQTHA